jgi:homoserine kinase type II
MAVYTKITKQEIAQHLQKYQLGELIDFKEIVEGIDNSNFILETSAGRFILTIFESRINKNDLPFFINLKLHLAQKKVLCPQPILDNEGSAIVEIQEKKSVIVTFLDGATLKTRDDGYYDNITTNHCFEVGKNLAKLHEAAKDFTMSRSNELGINGWKALFLKFGALTANYEKNLEAEIFTILDFLKNSWRFDLPSAACHLDLFPDNVFFDKNAKFSGVIDFYFAANEALIYDFAIIVNAWCFDEKNNFCEEKFLEMLRGYEEVRKFVDSEKNFLKIALVAAALRFLLTRLNDMFFTPKNALVKIKNPQEYLAKLRFFYSKL